MANDTDFINGLNSALEGIKGITSFLEAEMEKLPEDQKKELAKEMAKIQPDIDKANEDIANITNGSTTRGNSNK